MADGREGAAGEAACRLWVGSSSMALPPSRGYLRLPEARSQSLALCDHVPRCCVQQEGLEIEKRGDWGKFCP